MSKNSKSMKGSRYRCLLATEMKPAKARWLLEEICNPLPVKVNADDEYFPQGFSKPKELILTSYLGKDFIDNQFPDPGFKNFRAKVKDE